ncbi:hypothetical protein H8958_019257, partial [Nasalis larvatus]
VTLRLDAGGIPSLAPRIYISGSSSQRFLSRKRNKGESAGRDSLLAGSTRFGSRGEGSELLSRNSGESLVRIRSCGQELITCLSRPETGGKFEVDTRRPVCPPSPASAAAVAAAAAVALTPPTMDSFDLALLQEWDLESLSEINYKTKPRWIGSYGSAKMSE